jgi:serine/threonine protein kinase
VDRGTTLSAFELADRIGGRGLAHVFLARRIDRPGASRLVIKALRSDLASKPEAVETFKAKTRIASLASHPHLVRTVEVGGSTDGAPFIAMEFVDGIKLSQLLSRDVQIPIGIAVEIARQIASALDHLHTLEDENGPLAVVHLEVSPENVILTRDGRAKLVDVGVPATSVRWDAGHIVSNVAFLAPEQTRRERQIDQGADLFSLGRLLGLLAERSPFRDQQFVNIVARATAVRPEERYSNAADFADALDVYLLTQPQFNADVAIRSLVTQWEHAVPASVRTMVDPLASGHSSDIYFSTDTRRSTIDLRPRPPQRSWFWPAVIGGLLILAGALTLLLLLR